jgi:hypothetical protein
MRVPSTFRNWAAAIGCDAGNQKKDLLFFAVSHETPTIARRANNLIEESPWASR